MDEALYEQLFEAESRHWWCVARRRIVVHLVERFLRCRRDGRPRVLEFGCGAGLTLADLGARYEVLGVDASPVAARLSARRGLRVLTGTLPDRVPVPEGAFDAVLLLDVLEHIQRDAEAAASALRCVAPGGILVATAPACPWLYTARDTRHGHRRRYTRRQFGRLFRLPGFTVRRLSYFNTFLFPLAAAFRLGPKPRSWLREVVDLNLPPAPINRLFERIFASEVRWLTHTALPIGLSVLCVAIRA